MENARARTFFADANRRTPFCAALKARDSEQRDARPQRTSVVVASETFWSIRAPTDCALSAAIAERTNASSEATSVAVSEPNEDGQLVARILTVAAANRLVLLTHANKRKACKSTQKSLAKFGARHGSKRRAPLGGRRSSGGIQRKKKSTQCEDAKSAGRLNVAAEEFFRPSTCLEKASANCASPMAAAAAAAVPRRRRLTCAQKKTATTGAANATPLSSEILKASSTTAVVILTPLVISKISISDAHRLTPKLTRAIESQQTRLLQAAPDWFFVIFSLLATFRL